MDQRDNKNTDKKIEAYLIFINNDKTFKTIKQDGFLSILF